MVCLQMMTPLQALLVLAACLVTSEGAARIPFRSAPIFSDDNSLSPVPKFGGGRRVYQPRDYVNIERSGPIFSVAMAGTRVELECDAKGSPPPSIQWLRNGEIITQGLDENNSVGELRMGLMRGRLVLECVTPQHQGSYTCLASSGLETAKSVPSILLVNDTMSSPCPIKINASPRITMWSELTMETLGNDVTLPCVAFGNPAPQIHWESQYSNRITANSPDNRIKVLESGYLQILSLRWTDMGAYTCVAESHLGVDSITTFLYPLAKDQNSMKISKIYVRPTI